MLSVEDAATVISALAEKFPAVVGPSRDDICYATQNRQDAVRHLAEVADVVLVIGSRSSSNSNRLREVANSLGVPAHLIEDASQIKAEWIDGAAVVGVTAGASAPEELVQEVVVHLSHRPEVQVSQLAGVVEDITFALPKALQHDD